MPHYHLRAHLPIVQHPSIITGQNPYGDPVFGFGVDIERLVYGWYVVSVSEDGVQGGRTIQVLQVLSPTYPVSTDDEFSVPGYGRLAVQGHPQVYDNGPFGFEPGMTINLQLTEG